MKYFVTLALAVTTLFICNCGGGDSGSGKPAPVKGTTIETATDQTDTSECHGTPPVGSSIVGKWYTLMKGPTISYVMSFDINENNTTITNQCYINSGDKGQASVNVPSSYTSTQYNILGSDSNEQSNGSVKCTVSAQTGSLEYSLVGTCLKIKHGTQEGYLVSKRPTNF